MEHRYKQFAEVGVRNIDDIMSFRITVYAVYSDIY